MLHTSDWHLGASLKHASRDAEHAAFLDWLLVELAEREIEVMLLAGDVFHTMNPPAEALSLYYGFLARASQIETLRHVVVIGGNHDSPSRLDAPEAVLSALRVTVVGGYTRDERDRCLVPITADDGTIEAVVAAVPFVHEYRLGIRTGGRSPSDIEMDLRRAFWDIYDDAAKASRALAPDAPLIGMGHLTCRGVDDDDYATAIHLAKSVGGFRSDLFGPEYAYVALGHIHRMIAVEGDRVRYSGTPVATNRKEARSSRYVLQVDVGEGPKAQATVTPIEVPTSRPIVALRGPIDTVVAELRGLKWDSELLPYVLAVVEVEARGVSVVRRLHEALEALPESKRPLLVDVQERLVRSDADPEPRRLAVPAKPLAQQKPEDVFKALYASKNEGEMPPSALLQAFRSLLSEPKEDA